MRDIPEIEEALESAATFNKRKKTHTILHNDASLVCGWEDNRILGTAFIAARADNQFLREMLKCCAVNLLTNPSGIINVTTGPEVFTSVLRGASSDIVLKASS